MVNKADLIRSFQEVYQDRKERSLIITIKELARSLDYPIHINELIESFPDATKEMIEENFVVDRKGYLS